MTSTPDPALGGPASARASSSDLPAGGWARAGLLAGTVGLATNQLGAELLSVGDTPFGILLSAIVAITPGETANATVEVLATIAKPALLGGLVLVVAALFAIAGRLWRRALWMALPVWGLLGGASLTLAVVLKGFGGAQVWPVVIGFVTWLVAMGLLARVLRRREDLLARAKTDDDTVEHPGLVGRRGVLGGFGLVGSVGVAAAAGVTVVESRRSVVQGSRSLLRIPGVTLPEVPAGVLKDVDGLSPWQTPNDDFFVVHSGLSVPAVEAKEWVLRIHGRVANPIELTYDDLLARGMAEAWVTLGCVTNDVGGTQVGNAWWSGVPTRDLLAVAGPLEGADAVLQTSVDGWTCLTPVAALTDGRDSMLAVAMNGEPLPLEHGFPVRTVVPGLYGFTSACKWVVDWEVTSFDDASSSWIDQGWVPNASTKLSSRIEIPAAGAEVEAGEVVVAGYAWHQGVGISEVEVALDGGGWEPVRLAGSAGNATWVQWTGRVTVGPGEHVLRVRAGNRQGAEQVGVPTDPFPDGATGWHEVAFTAYEPDGE